MELEDTEDEDCTIYIEELRSEDANMKINAVSKIVSIANILGARRVREELLPCLVEIIAEQSNEDEFLIKLSTQIQQLSECVGGKEFEHLLIPPLELLVSMEEVSVRENAVTCINSIAASQDANFFTNTMKPMISTLSQWDNSSSRVSACSLLGNNFGKFPESVRQECIEIFQDHCKDDMPTVRRTAAMNLPNIAEHLKDEVIVSTLIPLWQQLVRDATDSVKVKAIESSEKLIQKLGRQQGTELFLPVLREVVAYKNKTWRVRYAVTEVLACLLSFTDKEQTKRETLQLYEQLLKDSEHEVRSIAISSLKTISSLLTDQNIISTILPLFVQLSQDPSQHVRISLSEVICTMGARFDLKILQNTIAPVIATLLKDETLEVRMSVMQHISSLISSLSAEDTKKIIVPLFSGIENDKQWRYRLAFVQFLPKLSMQLNGLDKTIQSLIDLFVLDHYAAIREQSFRNFIDFIALHEFAVVQPIIYQTLKSLVASTNYIFRVSVIQGISILAPKLSSKDLQILFEDFAIKLIGDPVVNVVISLLKLYLEIKDSLHADVCGRFTERAKRVLSIYHSTDTDVIHFLQFL